MAVIRFLEPHNSVFLLWSWLVVWFQRNGTLDEVSTINTGHRGMEYFGLLDKLNGLDHLPFWEEAPCNSINASEGTQYTMRFPITLLQDLA